MKEKEVIIPDVYVMTLYTWLIRSVTVLLYSCTDIELRLGLGRTKRKKAEECTCYLFTITRELVDKQAHQYITIASLVVSLLR